MKKIIKVKGDWNLISDWRDEVNPTKGISENVVCYLENGTKLCLASVDNLKWAEHPCKIEKIKEKFEGKKVKHIKGDVWEIEKERYKGRVLDYKHYLKWIDGWVQDAFVKRNGHCMEHWEHAVMSIIDELINMVGYSGNKEFMKEINDKREVIKYKMSGIPHRFDKALKDFDGKKFFDNEIQVEIDQIAEIFEKILKVNKE